MTKSNAYPVMIAQRRSFAISMNAVASANTMINAILPTRHDLDSATTTRAETCRRQTPHASMA